MEGGKAERELYYATSGMDALSTALTIALDSSGGAIDRPTKSLDYFEMTDLLEKLNLGEVVSPDSGVIVAALHPSTPFEGQNIESLVARITQRIKVYTASAGEGADPRPPLSLVLDTTIETGGRELDDLWRALAPHVENGTLNVFTAKSYHKYATLGTSKLSAGEISLVGRTKTHGFIWPKTLMRLNNWHLDFASSPDAQLMTHILLHAADDELSLIKSATANAKFVDDVCWPPRGDGRDSKFVPGIPLLFRAMGGADVRPFVKLLNIDQRDSFSFLRTSHVPIDLHDGCVRLNPGHESEAAMVEYFYALGHLATRQKPGKPVKAEGAGEVSLVLALEHLAALNGLEMELRQSGKKLPFANNIRASYLYLASSLIPSPDASEKNRVEVRDALARFIDGGMLGVTRDMQSLLAKHYLERCCEDWERAPSARRLELAARMVPRADGESILKKLPVGVAPELKQTLTKALTTLPTGIRREAVL